MIHRKAPMGAVAVVSVCLILYIMYMSSEVLLDWGEGPINVLWQREFSSEPQNPVYAPLIRDMEGRSYRIWKDDAPSSPCYNYTTRFGVNIPRVWLASFPSSGNSWSRYLIEASTGVFTGSVYNDRGIYSKGHLGEYESVRSGRTLTQKDHRYFTLTDSLIRHKAVINPNITTILLLRNPSKSIISFWHFKYNNKHHQPNAQISLAPSSSFETKEFHNHAKLSPAVWEQLALDLLIWTTAPLYIVYYENLKANPVGEIRKLLDFLRIPIDEQRMKCVESHLTGDFKRNSTEDFNPYTDEEKQRIAASVSKVHRLIKAMGYPDPPVYKNVQK